MLSVFNDERHKPCELWQTFVMSDNHIDDCTCDDSRRSSKQFQAFVGIKGREGHLNGAVPVDFDTSDAKACDFHSERAWGATPHLPR